MRTLYSLSLVFSTVLLMSCGEKNEANEGTEVTLERTSTSEVGSSNDGEIKEMSNAKASENFTEVKLTANDQMQFGKNEIRVKAGQTVKLTLIHIGKMSKDVMGHNFVLLKPGTEISKFGQAAANAKANDYIPQGADQVIAHTKLIGGGEETTIEFKAPEKGTYTFICSFPGHYAIMQGKFIVE